MASRSQLVRTLTADETEALLAWFVESYEEGWRPVMQSHRVGVSGRYEPHGSKDLFAKAERLLADIGEQRGER